VKELGPEELKALAEVLPDNGRPRRKWNPSDGADVLDAVSSFVGRFIAYRSSDELVAVTLWAAHAHALDAFESTPRLALLSPEKGSGKTRTLEVLDQLVPNPMHAANLSVAALFRQVASKQATVLLDECDTYLGPRAAEKHEELRGLLNAGHRRGAVAYRCVGEPSRMQVQEFPAFAAVALAGLGDLPDTVLDRAVVIRMRRRAPGEHVEPFRLRKTRPVGHELRDVLAAWTASVLDDLREAEPKMPDGVEDRPADVWEPLLVIADAAGGTWPDRARAACVTLIRARAEADPSLGVRLLADLATVFAEANVDRLPSVELVEALVALEESPWADLRGKPLDANGLARRLRPYDIRPHTIRVGDRTAKGYFHDDFGEAWERYVPASLTPEPVTPVTADTLQVSAASGVTGASRVTGRPVPTIEDVTRADALTSDVTAVTSVTASREIEAREAALRVLGDAFGPGLEVIELKEAP
jgi:uncharacterized protein DUF3631